MWHRFPSGVRTFLGPLGVCALAIAGLFLPGPAWLSALADPVAASEFLGQLWQVIGATAGLAVAVVFFVFQGVAATRPTAMRDAGVAGPFRLLISLGVAALLTVGLDLLGFGHDAPGGWAAAWATCIAGVSIATLAFVFSIMLRAMDVSRLQRRRLRMIARQAAQHVGAEARLRVGFTLLDKLRDSCQFQLRVFGANGQSANAVSAERPGSVVDINIRLLQNLSRRAQDAGHPAPELFVYIGCEVTDGTPLISIDDPQSRKIARRVVTIRHARTDEPQLDLKLLAGELHGEAIQAIRGALLGTYDDLAEAQASLLLAIPEAWERKFGQQYTNELASGIFPLALGPLDRVSRNIYEQVTATLSVGVRELALSAAYQPIYIATRAAGVGADGLVKEMMRVTRGVVTLQSHAEIAALVRDHAWTNFSHLLQFICALVEDTSASAERRRQAAAMVTYGLEIVAHIAKDTIDSHDSAMFEKVDRGWSHIHEFWLDEQAADYLPESLDKDLAIRVRDERNLLQFAVACWLIHRLLANPGNPHLVSMFEKARSRYSNPAEIARSATLTGASEGPDVLSDWVLDDLPSDEVHNIDSQTPLLSAAALLLLATRPEGGGTLDPSPWVLSNRQGLLEVVDSLSRRPEIRTLLPSTAEDFDSVVAATKSAIAEAAHRQAEIDDSALIAATVSDEVRHRFHELVRQGWEDGRTILGLLLSAGGSRVRDSGDAPAARLTIPPSLEWKLWAVDQPDQPGLQQIARRLGQALASGENRELIKRMSPTADLEGLDPRTVDSPVAYDLIICVDQVIKQMREEGYRPSLLLHGWNLHLIESLTVAPIGDSQRIDSRARDIRGQRDGLIVARTSHLDNQTILIMDASAWGEVREWGENAGGGLIATLTTYNAATARQLIESQPDLLSSDLSESDKIRELQRRMLVSISVSTQIVVKDPSAARAVGHGDHSSAIPNVPSVN
jgi:hypothetical protein